ncbi:MAG: hypothetical protein ACI9UN_001220 [Granulosicoccus sp.]|jgi:hypothetical protein
MIFNVRTLQFQDDTDPSLTIVSLPNPNAEQASAAGLITQSNSPTGMTVTGDCAYSNIGVAASHGKWKFELGPGCSILQTSDDTFQRDQAIE